MDGYIGLGERVGLGVGLGEAFVQCFGLYRTTGEIRHELKIDLGTN